MSARTENRSHAGSVPPGYDPGPASETTVASDSEVKDQVSDVSMSVQHRQLSVGRAKEEEVADDLYEKRK